MGLISHQFAGTNFCHQIGPITRRPVVFDVIKISTNPCTSAHAPSHSAGPFSLPKYKCVAFGVWVVAVFLPLQNSICNLGMFSWSMSYEGVGVCFSRSCCWCSSSTGFNARQIPDRGGQPATQCTHVPNQVMGQGFTTPFTAEQAYMQQAAWEFTQDPWVLSTIKGYKMTFSSTPHLLLPNYPSEGIEQIHPTCPFQDGRDPVLEGALPPRVLHDQTGFERIAYFSIPIHTTHQRFLSFTWEGQSYQFTCLPFGFSSAPRTFTKGNEAVSYLRSLGIWLWSIWTTCWRNFKKGKAEVMLGSLQNETSAA